MKLYQLAQQLKAAEAAYVEAVQRLYGPDALTPPSDAPPEILRLKDAADIAAESYRTAYTGATPEARAALERIQRQEALMALIDAQGFITHDRNVLRKSLLDLGLFDQAAKLWREQAPTHEIDA